MAKLPGVPHLQAVRALQKAGFRLVRQGKHIVMSDGTRILTIPRANPVNVFTMGGIVRDAGLTKSSRSCCSRMPSNKALQLTVKGRAPINSGRIWRRTVALRPTSAAALAGS